MNQWRTLLEFWGWPLLILAVALVALFFSELATWFMSLMGS